MPHTSSGVVNHAPDMAVNVEGDYSLSNFPSFGFIDVRSSLVVDFSLIQKNCDEYLIACPSIAGD